MLHTNISTRPFYNVRAVRAMLGTLALLVAAAPLSAQSIFDDPDLEPSKPRASCCETPQRRFAGTKASASQFRSPRLLTTNRKTFR